MGLDEDDLFVAADEFELILPGIDDSASPPAIDQADPLEVAGRRETCVPDGRRTWRNGLRYGAFRSSNRRAL